MQPVAIATVLAALVGLSHPVLAEPAAVPLADFDDDALLDDWRVTFVLSASVVGKDGTYVGAVQDLILGSDGLVRSVVISRSTRHVLDQQYLAVEWPKVDFEPRNQRLEPDSTAKEVSQRAWDELPPVAGLGEWKASRLIGMDVRAREDVPEGEVEDLLIEGGATRMSAFVVQSDHRSERYYAIPGEPGFVDYGKRRLELPYPPEEIRKLPDLPY